MDYEQFKEARNQHQSEVVAEFSALPPNNMLIVDSPTGSGKTHIDIFAAQEYKKQFPKLPIIISTNTNKNAIDIIKKAKDTKGIHKLTDDDIVLEIGKNHYIDIVSLVETIKTDEIYQGIFKEDEKSLMVEKYYDFKQKQFKNDILIDTLVEDFELDRFNTGLISRFAQDDYKTIDPKNIKNLDKHLESGKIIVTNHAYILILYTIYASKNNKNLHTKNLLLEAPIIFDEFHQLSDAASVILNKSFSLFRLRYSVSNILTLVKNKDTKYYKDLKNIQNISQLIENNIANADTKVSKTKVAIDGISSIKSSIGNREGINRLIKKIITQMQKEKDENKHYRIAITELQELSNIALGLKQLVVDFSPKNYPTIKLTGGISTYSLMDKLWLKSKGKILALSGTLRTKRVKDREAFEWMMIRNGLYTIEQKEKKEELEKAFLQPNTNLTPEAIELILLQNQIVNEKINNTKFMYIPSLFRKNKTLATIPTFKEIETPKRNIYIKDEDSDKSVSHKNENIQKELSEWSKNIGKFIANNFRTNALVLAVSYQQVKEIALSIKEHDEEIEVVYHEEMDKINNNIAKFLKAQKNGRKAILVGTDQYFTGLDLKGGKLENLFIARLPYKFGFPSGPKASTKYKHWEHNKGENYFFEMFFKFMQGVGRLSRDFNDKGIIYILDSKINTDKHLLLKEYLEEKSILMPYEEVLSKREIFEDNKNNPKSNLFAFVSSYYPIISFKELLEKFKIDDADLEELYIATKLLVQKKIFISLKTQEELEQKLLSDKFNIWTLIGDLLLTQYKINTEKECLGIIIDNDFFGEDSFASLIKNIVVYKKIYKKIDDFCSYVVTKI